MIYEICHRLEYRYSSPVYLEPHRLHLTPRSDSFQSIRTFSLKIEPEPLLANPITDALGNPAHEVWFRGQTDQLIIEALSTVTVSRQNPFDYLLRDSSLRLPAKYPKPLLPLLRSFCGTVKEDDDVFEFTDHAARRADYETIAFLSELCLQIRQNVRHIHREEGDPWTPGKTLKDGKGACRDLAVLFIACCRMQGLAARFTSGYAQGASNSDGDDLHAWAEVYLEGAGWRGYDPSTGLAVCEQHVALASSPDPLLVTPLFGSYRTQTAVSKFEAQVRIQALSEQAPLILPQNVGA